MAAGRWRREGERLKSVYHLFEQRLLYIIEEAEINRNQIAGTNVRSLKNSNQKTRNDISLSKLNWITGPLSWKSWFALPYNLGFSSDTTNHKQNILNYYSIWHFMKRGDWYCAVSSDIDGTAQQQEPANARILFKIKLISICCFFENDFQSASHLWKVTD